jgi:hypothetical protein
VCGTSGLCPLQVGVALLSGFGDLNVDRGDKKVG